MLTNQDKAYLKAQMDKGMSYDDAFKKLKSVKAKITPTATSSMSAPVKSEDTMANIWGETGEKPNMNPLAAPFDLAKGLGQSAISTIGAGAEALGKGISGLGAEKVGGFLQEQGQAMQDEFSASQDASMAEKAGRIGGELAITGLGLANPVSGGLRTLGAKGAQALGGGKLAQLMAAGLVSSPVDTTIVSGAATGDLPTGEELATGAAIDVALPPAFDLLKGSAKFLGDLYETYKTKGKSSLVVDVLKEVKGSPEDAAQFMSMVEDYKAHAKNPAQLTSPLAKKGQEVLADYETLLIPKQKQVGEMLSQEARSSRLKADAATPYEKFKEYLKDIKVDLSQKFSKNGLELTEEEATNLIAKSDSSAAQRAVDIEKAQMNSYLEPYAKIYKQAARNIQGFDGLDWRSAIEKTKSASSKTAQKFYDKFKGLDSAASEFKSMNPSFEGSTDDMFDQIKTFTKSATSKVKDGVKFTEDLDFGNSIIQFTKDDQNTLINVFHALKAKAEKGEKFSLEDIWNLARSLEAIGSAAGKNLASPVTDAALVPVKALDRFARETLEKHLSPKGKELYSEYAKLARARGILSKNLKDFGAGSESMLESILSTGAKGFDAKEALKTLGEVSKKDYLRAVEKAAAAEELGGNKKVGSIIRGLSPRGVLMGAVEDAVMSPDALLQELKDVISGEAKKLNVDAGALGEATRNILKWIGLEITN